jgi:hypothetical protein
VRTQSPDTHPDAERVQLEALERLGGAGRVDLMRSLSRSVRRLAREAVRRDAPGLSPLEENLRMIEICYGEECARRVRAWLAR